MKGTSPLGGSFSADFSESFVAFADIAIENGFSFGFQHLLGIQQMFMHQQLSLIPMVIN